LNTICEGRAGAAAALEGALSVCPRAIDVSANTPAAMHEQAILLNRAWFDARITEFPFTRAKEMLIWKLSLPDHRLFFNFCDRQPMLFC
jgi:hypothetical protein